MASEESYPKLISLAVHELRSPLSVLSGYLRMLQRDTEPAFSDRQRQMVEELEKSCNRLVGLVAALSEIGKIDDGQITMSPKKIDLFRLIAELAKSVHESEERGVRFEVRGITIGAEMAGDEQRLRSAFEAIIHAILREQAGPSTVVADCRLAGDRGGTSAVIVIAEESSVQTAYDTPRGPFDEKRGGVGLSLPLARRVIEAHGGRLESPVLPDARAARSTAIVNLPLEFSH
jgi:two-component system cell cycle sensor histidine kinase PleC